MTLPEPQTAGERRATWLLLLVALALSTWLLRRARSSESPAPERVELVSLVPSGPELLVTIDVEALGAAAAKELLEAGGAALLGLHDLCGFEPILGVKRVAFAMPFQSQPDQNADFALIAETALEPERVLRCAEAVVRQRGGQPVRSQLGHFTSVRDQAKPLGEMAIRADGLFVLSGGQYFRDVVDAANGTLLGDEASRLRTRLHLGMRRRLAPAQLAFTLIPSPALPLPGVQALGLGLDVQRDVKLRGFVGCPSAAACAEAREQIERLRTDLSRDRALSGLATLTVAERGSELDLQGHLPREQLGPLMTQLLSP